MFLKSFSRWWSDQATNTYLNTVSSKPDLSHPMSSTDAMKSHSALRSSDFWIYRIVVTALGSTLIICTVGAISLEIKGKSTPALVSSLGTGSLAAIAGLLVPSPIKR